MTKSNVGKKRWISTDKPSSLSIVKESWSRSSRMAGAWRQGLKQKSGRKAASQLAVPTFLSLLSYTPRPPAQEGHHPHWSGRSHLSHRLRTCTTDLPTSKPYRDIFPSSQMCQVNKKLAAKVFCTGNYITIHLFTQITENTLQVYFPGRLICYHEEKLSVSINYSFYSKNYFWLSIWIQGDL